MQIYKKKQIKYTNQSRKQDKKSSTTHLVAGSSNIARVIYELIVKQFFIHDNAHS
ncbi:MAG: hypothetical protein ACM3XP_03685 [Nitrososphaerales archaeon]